MDSIPNELLLAILDEVEDSNRQTILALNRTCQRLHDLTTERLYRQFRGAAPEQFLRAIALPPPYGRPALANCVKEVIWTHDYAEQPSDHNSISPVSRHLLAQALHASDCVLMTRDPCVDLPSAFLDFKPDGIDSDLYLEFFLFFVPKIESLVVRGTRRWQQKMYWFETVAANPTHFQHLKSVTIDGSLQLETAVPLLTLPSLRYMDLSGINSSSTSSSPSIWEEYDPPNRVENVLADGCSLTHFSLRNGRIWPSRLFALYKNFKNLKSFTCESIRCARDIFGRFDYDVFRISLHHSRATLEELSFLKGNAYYGHDMSNFFVHRYSVDIFENLRTLTLSTFHFSTYWTSDNSQDSTKTTALELSSMLPSPSHNAELRVQPHVRFRKMSLC